MTSKQDLRRLFRQRRQEQLSLGSVICRQVQTLVQASPVRTGHLGLYWPLNGEVDLRTIRLAISNEVALPFADGCGGLHYRHWTDTPLQADGCGIPAPNDGQPLPADQLSLLLVPALAIDRTGIRLGYGGGYYDRLRAVLAAKFPKADPALVEHVVPLAAAFDTAVAFALSFGIAKFQLAQKEVKLVGEYVGEQGRRPNPDLIRAIKNWPAIRDLKDLQSYLGTTNYARPHAGPAYARVMHPPRAFMKPNAVFPPNDEQQRAIQGLKDLMEETH